MQEHPTTSPDQPAESGGSQVDDINIPLVAVSVAFFACLLAVTILSLQAWFMNAKRAEEAAQTLAQEDPKDYAVLSTGNRANGGMKTPLGETLLLQRTQLHVPPADRQWIAATEPATTKPATATAAASAPAKKLWVSIDTAMDLVSKEYQQGAKP